MYELHCTNKGINKMMKKIMMTFVAFIVVATGCAPTQKSNGQIQVTNINDMVPFVSMDVDRVTNEVIVRNILVNKEKKDITDVTLTGGSFNDILPPEVKISTAQYYSDRLIIGAMDSGGRSIEFVQEGGAVAIREHKFNIGYYDENQKKYITQTRPEDEEDGYRILNAAMGQEDFIPLPVDSEDISRTGTIQAFNLETFLYVGDKNGKKFQVEKYDMEAKRWTNVASLLPEDVYNGYEGYADMSYDEQYPDWVALTIHTLYNDTFAPKEINKLFFVNLRTSEIRERNIPLFAQEPIRTTSTKGISMIQSKDRIVILDMNPDGVQVIEELAIENIVPFGEQHINSVEQYTSADMVINTPDGLIKYTFATRESEYILDYTLQE